MLANVSDIAYMPVQLTETATGNHPKIAIVGQDGVPYPEVQHPVFENGTRLLIPPATRYAIAVTMPADGDLILEMPPRGGGATTISAPGVLYTNDGTENPPATLGSLSVSPSAVSYYDGFFVSPTQVLARATTSAGKGVTTAFERGQKLDAYTVFEDISQVKPDVERELVISGGFLNNLASTDDPKAFVYAFDGIGFPNAPLLQPRLGSVEEWTFLNNNNDEHPIHIHVNDFQVTHYFDPTRGLETGPDMWAVDNANVPAPVMGAEESVIQPGALSLRMKFDDYTGLFVMHCHRLNHEDNGLMTLVNVIPAVSTYAVAVPGSPGHAAEVKVYDGNGDRLVATVTPFPGFEGTPSVAMGDVDDDGVYDLVVGAGKDHAPEVVAYAGKAKDGKAPFATELARFEAFDSAARGGVSVAASQIDGSTADNIIVGSGPGILERGQGLSRQAAGSEGHGARAVLHVQSLSRRSQRRERRLGLRRFHDRPLQHRHRSGGGKHGAGEGLQFLADEADRPEEAHRPGRRPVRARRQQARGHQRLHAVRHGLSRRLVVGHRLAHRIAGRRRDGSSSASSTGPGEVKVYSSGSRLEGGPKIYLAERGAHARRHLCRDRELQAIRRSVSGRERRDDQHDDRRRPAGERHLAGRQERAGPEIRVRQARSRRRHARRQAAQHRRLGRRHVGRTRSAAIERNRERRALNTAALRAHPARAARRNSASGRSAGKPRRSPPGALSVEFWPPAPPDQLETVVTARFPSVDALAQMAARRHASAS